MDKSLRSRAAEAIRSTQSNSTTTDLGSVTKRGVKLSDLSFEVDTEAAQLIEAERSKLRDALDQA